MKKIVAILLSALLLCAMIPFATVAAAEDVTVQLSIVDELTEVNAGDEFQVQVDLLGLDSTAGLIGARVEIGFDSDVFELVTYFDEDEEMWMPPIEVGSKYNASSNKYIMYSPIDEETGEMNRCLVKYMRATATATQVRKEEHFYTVTLKVKDDAVSGTYNLTVVDNEGVDLLAHGNLEVPYDTVETSITVIGSEPEVPSCQHEYTYPCDAHCALCGELTNEAAEHSVKHVEAVDATCYENGNIEYWYCEYCGSAWADEALTQVTNMMSVVVPMGHGTIAHVEAVEPTCYENGNIEYWYCEACGQAWLDEACTLNTNLMAVVLPMAHGTITHVEAVAPTCYENGNIEYWYCEACGQAWLDADCTLNTNLLAVVLPMAHGTIAHVEAVAPTCYENGNIEYWYCEACGQAWLDAECTLNTNLLAVVLPMAHGTIIAVDAVAPTCYENGNIAYWYCEDCGQAWLDAECTLNTNLLAVVLPMAHGEIVAVEAKDATCTELGNIAYWYCADCGQAWLDAECTLNTNLMAVKLPTIDHVYTNAHDVDCDVCGEIRDVVLGADEIIIEAGNSITEIKGGLGFKFDVAANGIVIGEDYIADYSNATVVIEGVEYKLIGMGAIANNKGYAEQTLENVDDTYVLNIVAEKVFEDAMGATSYAVRIINIPEEHLDTEITVRSYYTYECEGEQITVYGEDWTTSFNAELAELNG